MLGFILNSHVHCSAHPSGGLPYVHDRTWHSGRLAKKLCQTCPTDRIMFWIVASMKGHKLLGPLGFKGPRRFVINYDNQGYLLLYPSVSAEGVLLFGPRAEP